MLQSSILSWVCAVRSESERGSGYFVCFGFAGEGWGGRGGVIDFGREGRFGEERTKDERVEFEKGELKTLCVCACVYVRADLE